MSKLTTKKFLTYVRDKDPHFPKVKRDYVKDWENFDSHTWIWLNFKRRTNAEKLKLGFDWENKIPFGCMALCAGNVAGFVTYSSTQDVLQSLGVGLGSTALVMPIFLAIPVLPCIKFSIIDAIEYKEYKKTFSKEIKQYEACQER